jgi:hypothetical protein
MDRIDEMEKNEQWTEELIYDLEEEVIQKGDVQSYVHLLFICWYLILERGVKGVDHDIPDDFLTEKLEYFYKKGLELFSESDIFCFYIGWMVSIAGWYFGVKDNDTGDMLKMKAYWLKPGNPLYKWVCYQDLGLTKDEGEQIRKQIDQTQFDGFGFAFKDYFMQTTR